MKCNLLVKYGDRPGLRKFEVERNILIWTDFLYCVVHNYFNFGRVFLMFVRTEDSVHVVKLWLESISKNILTEA